eukprot:5900510-Ditylum_brightwellii.AAC.1
MSATAARRCKQLSKKAAQDAEAAAAALSSSTSTDPVILRLNSIFQSKNAIDKSMAYKALQLAQSQVRRL